MFGMLVPSVESLDEFIGSVTIVWSIVVFFSYCRCTSELKRSPCPNQVVPIDGASSFDFQGSVTHQQVVVGASKSFVRIVDRCIEVHTRHPDDTRRLQLILRGHMLQFLFLIACIVTQCVLLWENSPSSFNAFSLLCGTISSAGSVEMLVEYTRTNDSVIQEVQEKRRSWSRSCQMDDQRSHWSYVPADKVVTRNEHDYLIVAHLKKFRKGRGDPAVLEKILDIERWRDHPVNDQLRFSRTKRGRVQFWTLENIRPICEEFHQLQRLRGFMWWDIDLVLKQTLQNRRTTLLNLCSKASKNIAMTRVSKSVGVYLQHHTVEHHINKTFDSFSDHLSRIKTRFEYKEKISLLIDEQTKYLSSLVRDAENRGEPVRFWIKDSKMLLLKMILNNDLSITTVLDDGDGGVLDGSDIGSFITLMQKTGW